MKIYIIEDEKAIRDELELLLDKYGYKSESSDDFQNIVSLALYSKPDLILLDINLPYKDGYEICREIRMESDIPIIILTSNDTDFDELMSLNIGADDFITKPYNPQVLLARIQKILERVNKKVERAIINYNDVSLDLLKAELTYNDNILELTKNELNILRLLMQNSGNIIPREEIINELWQDEQFIDENTLNVNIVRLRKKLSDIGLDDFLKTKRGLGYFI